MSSAASGINFLPNLMIPRAPKTGAKLEDLITWSQGTAAALEQFRVLWESQTESFISSSAYIGDLVVANAHIQDLAVTTAKIDSAAITTAKITDLAVTTAKVASANITTAKIADLAVQTAKIDDLAVTTAKVASANITSAKIADLAVTTAKIDSAAITTAKITDLSVTTLKRMATNIQGPTARTVTKGSAQNFSYTFTANNAIMMGCYPQVITTNSWYGPNGVTMCIYSFRPDLTLFSFGCFDGDTNTDWNFNTYLEYW